MYRLDRTVFKEHTAEEATKSHAEYHRRLTWQERVRISNYLNSIAFNFSENNPPKLDRTKFSVRTRK